MPSHNAPLAEAEKDKNLSTGGKALLSALSFPLEVLPLIRKQLGSPGSFILEIICWYLISCVLVP